MACSGSNNRQVNRQRWIRLIQEWKQSGLSQSAFCRERNLKFVTFNWWTRKAVDTCLSTEKLSSSGSPEFFPVRVAGSGLTSRTPFEILLRGGHTLRVAQDFDSRSLQRLIAVLEGGEHGSC